MKIVSLILFALIGFTSASMTPEEVIEKVKQTYLETKQFEYKTSYELYKGHENPLLQSTYSGFTYRSDKFLYQKIGATEHVNGDKFSLRLNSEQQVMILGDYKKEMNQDFDIATFLSGSVETKIIENGSYYHVKITYGASSKNQLAELHFQADKITFQLQQLEMYFSHEEDFSSTYGKSDLAKPYLKITFSEMNTTPTAKPELFEFSSYVTDSEKTTLETRYNGYTLHDNRTK